MPMSKEDNIIILNPKQQDVLDAVDAGLNVCLLASGGKGKTTVLRAIREHLKKEGKNVVVCAPTGIAADQAGGLTIHKTFGFEPGIAITEKMDKPKERAPKWIRTADVVIIDEISMVRIDYLDAMVASLAKANKSRDRGGKNDIQLIVAGDFSQLPPVMPDEERALLEVHYHNKLGSGFAFSAPMWKKCNFVYMTLDEVVRQNDKDFVDNLEKLRVGDVSCIPFFNENCREDWQEDAISLYPYRDQVKIENEDKLNMIDGPEYVFEASFEGEANEADLGSLSRELHLKEGVPVLFVRNQNSAEFVDCLDPPAQKTPSSGLYHNGDIGQVVAIEPGDGTAPDYIYVKVKGRILGLVPHRFRVFGYVVRKGKIGTEMKGFITQFPIVLGYAVTVHKAQGMTLEKANVDPSCFTAGQLYVAMSRCRKIQNISLTRPIFREDIMVNMEVRRFYDSINLNEKQGEQRG